MPHRHRKGRHRARPPCRRLLAAWWNAGECGSFDLTNLWAVDDAIATDMLTVFALIAKVKAYPDKLGYEPDFKAIVKAWRPELCG